uniref:Uncharacterized protein n=1 Tax=Arundo donax TaxID=35708 RepID=A0A0A9PR93_ARUDO
MHNGNTEFKIRQNKVAT